MSLPWCFIHEAGHFLAVWILGRIPLPFHLDTGLLYGIPVPRWMWLMPLGFTRPERMVICFAGFGLEFLAAGLFFFLPHPWGWIYLAGTCAHFLLYPHYAGAINDFNYYDYEEEDLPLC